MLRESFIFVSIHPMFRFKIVDFIANIIAFFGFNTSYVSVQEVELDLPDFEKMLFQYILCFGSRLIV